MVQEKQQKHGLGKIVKDVIVFTAIAGTVVYGGLGFGIRDYDDTFGGVTRRFENVSGYSGTVRTLQPFSGWKKDYFGLFSRRVTGMRIIAQSKDNLETFLEDWNANRVLEGDDYVQTDVNGKTYRVYGNGSVTDTKGKEVKDSAVTDKSKEILGKWNSLLAGTNFK